MVAAVASLAAVSCAQELGQVEVPAEASKFTAYAEGAAESKTVKDGQQSLWQSGDRIWVLNAKEGDAGWKKGYATSDNNTGMATFVEEDNSYALEGDKFFAVYPADAANAATWEGGDLMGVKLTPEQKAVAGSFDPAAHIAVSQTAGHTLSFKNAVSLFKFKVKNEGVKNVTIYSNNGEAITGLCNISAEGVATPWAGPNEANTWVELSAGEGVFEQDKEYYISVFPATLAGGFTVEFSFGAGKLKVKSYASELVLERNGVLDLGEIEYTEPVAEEFVPQDGYVYLKPNGNWKVDNARFAAYFFGNSEAWADMTLVEGQTDIYGCQVPAGYENVIFCRMNPSATANIWDNKWNQTADLKLADGCLYTVAEGAWDNGNGEWSGAPAVSAPDQPSEPGSGEPEDPGTEEPEEPVEPEEPGVEPDQPEETVAKLYLKPNSNWKVDNARFAAYFFGNGETWVSMSDPDGDGIYELVLPADKTYPSIIFCRMTPSAEENKWDNKWNQTNDLTIPTDGNNLYTIKEGEWDGNVGTWSKM